MVNGIFVDVEVVVDSTLVLLPNVTNKGVVDSVFSVNKVVDSVSNNVLSVVSSEGCIAPSVVSASISSLVEVVSDIAVVASSVSSLVVSKTSAE